jgi:hypothetical protein
MSPKNPGTPPGIDPGIVRLVAQRLNHYATPGLLLFIYIYIYIYIHINSTNIPPIMIINRIDEHQNLLSL